MQTKNSRFAPPIKKPIAGWRAYLGCLLTWLVGSVAAAELTLYALGSPGAAGASPTSALLIRQYGPLFELARLWEYALAFLVAAVPIVVGRKKLRIGEYGRFAGRVVVFAGDFFLSLAALAGAAAALGGVAFVLLGTNPFQSDVFLTTGATAAALVVALVVNEVRIRRFLTNLYQISMM